MTTEAKAPDLSNKMDDAAILAKAQRGETLTAAEQDHVAGAPSEAAPEPAEKEEGNEPGAAVSPSPSKKDGEKEPTETGPAAKKEKTPEERRAEIELDLEKPDHLVNLAGYTKVERGLYFDLKKARRKNQRIEAENRTLKFSDLKEALKEVLPAAKPEKEEGDDDPLAGRDDDDIVTVAEMRKIMAAKNKPAAAAKKEGEEAAAPVPLLSKDSIRIQTIEARSNLKAQGVEDYDDVINFAEWALAGDTEAQEDLREVAKAGGNVLERTYYLITGSKKWPLIEKKLAEEKGPAAKTDAPDPDHVARAEKIVKNGEKIRTTGSTGGGGTTGEYTVEQIMAMSPREFGALPQKTQDAILLKYGSDPNLS